MSDEILELQEMVARWMRRHEKLETENDELKAKLEAVQGVQRWKHAEPSDRTPASMTTEPDGEWVRYDDLLDLLFGSAANRLLDGEATVADLRELAKVYKGELPPCRHCHETVCRVINICPCCGGNMDGPDFFRVHPEKEPLMPHKISPTQYDQLPAWGFLRDKDLRWPAADRLLVGEGTDSDLDEVVKYCIKQNRHTLARELLQPPDQGELLDG